MNAPAGLPSTNVTGLAGKTRLVRALITIFGLLVGAGFLALAARNIDWPGALAEVQAAQWWPWLPLGISCYLAGQLIRGARCRILVRDQARLSTLTATNIVVVGYAVNNLAPLRLGEFARGGMLAERTGLPFTQALAITFLERVLDALTILTLFAVTLMVLPEPRFGSSPAFIIGAGVAGIALTVIGIGVAPNSTVMLASRLLTPLPARVHDRIVGLVAQVSAGFSCIRSASALAHIAGLSGLVWTLESCLYLCVMLCFRLEPHFALAVFVMATTNLFLLIPSTPGFVGTFEFAVKSALVGFGVAPTLALGVAVLAHISFFVPVTLWGVSAMAWYGVELGAVRALARSAPALSSLPEWPAKVITLVHGSTRSAQASPLLRAVSESFFPEKRLEHPAHHATVLDSVSSFVSEEMNALPGTYRFLLRFGLAGFAASTWLNTRRRFSSLPLETRVHYVRRWAWSSFTPARQLFRPLRSTALLAYYEHPDVSQALLADAQELTQLRQRG